MKPLFQSFFGIFLSIFIFVFISACDSDIAGEKEESSSII